MITLLAVLLVLASAYVHYEILWRLNHVLPRLHLYPARASVLLAVLGAFVSHFIQISLFACAYLFIQGRGEAGAGHMDFRTALYFSTQIYTTLGLGDIYPVSRARGIVEAESITGFLMISWTASFTFLEMNRFWSSRR